MKKIMLTYLGFKRREDLDFADDGNYFTGYEYKGIPVSYLRWSEHIYLTFRYTYKPLYEKYQALTEEQKFEIRDASGTLNGVEVENLTNEKIKEEAEKFYQLCVRYGLIEKQEQPKTEERKTEMETTPTKLTGLDLLLKQVSDNVEQSINAKSEKVIADIQKQVEDLKQYTPTVVIRDGIKKEVKGLKHCQLNDLILMVGAGLNVMLTGMAGTGKTKSAQQTAEALGLDFYCMSVGAQTSKSDLIGYMDANGKYVSTMFRKAYEKGGVFVMDEIDAGNSNVLIVLNSALSNGVCAFPDKMVEMNKDFRFIATANTYGNGADRTYVGRNQLDGATLDRFTTIEWKVDEKLEEALVDGFKYGKAWLETVRQMRGYVAERSMRAIISPRASVKGATVLEISNGDFELAFNACVRPQIPVDKVNSTECEMKSRYTQNLAKYGTAKKEQYQMEF